MGAEISKDIRALKEREFCTIWSNAILLCNMMEAITATSKLPDWMKEAIRMTIRPVILQGILNDRHIDFEDLKSAWQNSDGTRFKVSLVSRS